MPSLAVTYFHHRRNTFNMPCTLGPRGGSDDEGNRVLLCAFHHQRCLHAGLMRITGRAPQGLLFELGLRSTNGPLATYRSGDVLIPPSDGSGIAASERTAA
jgi:hypothetical protein